MSVLGLRRFKENLTALEHNMAVTDQWGYYAVYQDLHFEIEPVVIEAWGITVYGMTPLVNFTDNHTPTDYPKMVISATANDGSTERTLMSVDFSNGNIVAGMIVNVLSTANATVDEWLLVNTEAVIDGEYIITKSRLTSIADAIRFKDGTTEQIPTENMATKILAIETGITPCGSISIAENNTYDVTNYASAVVNVPIPDGYIVPSGSVTITENSTVDVTNYASAVVNVPIPEGYIVPSGSVTITENSTVDVTNYAEVVVNVADNPLPIEVSTEAEMTALLSSASVGSVYKYTGTTGTYENGTLYIVAEESE